MRSSRRRGTPARLLIGCALAAVLVAAGGVPAMAAEGSADQVLAEPAPADLVPVPIVTSPALPAGVVGASFTYQLTANVSPATFTVGGLPAGLRYDPATARIVGTPTVAGTSTVRLEAFGAEVADTSVVRYDDLVVTDPVVTPAVITSPPLTPGVVGTPYSFQLTSNVSPVTYSVSGLPAGLRADARTGAITGIPTAAGSFNVRLEAIGARTGDTSVVVYQTLVVTSPPVVVPVVTSAAPPIGVLNKPHSFQLTSSVPGATFEVTGLPAGLTASRAGLISGTPRVAGSFSVGLAAVLTSSPDTRVITYVTVIIAASGNGGGDIPPPTGDPGAAGSVGGENGGTAPSPALAAADSTRAGTAPVGRTVAAPVAATLSAHPVSHAQRALAETGWSTPAAVRLALGGAAGAALGAVILLRRRRRAG